MRQLKEAQAALEAATQACDDAFRAWSRTPPPARDLDTLGAAARVFSDAQRRVVRAQAALRQVPSERTPSEKSWGAH